MKKLISILACTLAAISVLVSCQPKETPDGKCELTAFSLTHSLNSTLPADIVGVIDAANKSIVLVVPTSVTTTSFIPTFTATQYDVVKIGGTEVTSGQTSVTITDGTKVSLSDLVSSLTAEYTITILANDEAAELVSVSFKAADNSLLEEDVAPEAIAPEMLVRVPGTAFRQELTLTVSAGSGDAISVNNTVVESGSSIKVDTSFPIDITVSDAIAGKSVDYVLKVGKILEVVVSKLGVYNEGTINDFTMTLNPTDNLPYLAYTRKVGEEKNNNVSIAKWNGNGFALVGPTGLADASSRSASKPKVAFGKDGTVYAFYLGGEVASRPTVKKLDSDWVLVGSTGFTPYNNNTSYYFPFFVHPSNGKPFYFWNGNTKNVDAYRTMNLSTFSGDSWSSSTVSGVIPAYGSGISASSGMYYTSYAALTGEKAYIASSFNQFGYYVHEVNADGSLTTIVDNYLPSDAPYGLPANLQLKAGKDGALYFFAANASGDGSMQIYSVDLTGKTLKSYGAGIPITIGSNGSISVGGAFGINPVDGLTVAVYGNKGEAPKFIYLDDSLQWSEFKVEAPVATATVFEIVYDKDGNGYAAYQSENGIELFRVGLEADILPE